MINAIINFEPISKEFESREYFRGWPGPELKEPIRKKIAREVDEYIHSGGCIVCLEPTSPRVEWHEKRKKPLRARESRSKLTAEAVREIRGILTIKNCELGWKENSYHKAFKWLAEEYNTTESNIRAIWFNKTWKDIENPVEAHEP